MPLSDADIELMDRRIRQELTADEERLFEERMTDPTFRIEWNSHLAIHQVILEKGRDGVRGILVDEEKRLSSRKISAKRWIWIGVILFLLSALAGYFLLRKDAPEQVYMAYYKPFPNDVDPIQKGENDLSVYQLYEFGEYQKVVQGLAPPFASEEDEWFYIQSIIALEKGAEAKTLLLNILKNTRHRYYEPAKWYLALLHIKENNSKDAIVLLNELSKKNGLYRSRSLELLSKIQ